MELGVLDHLPTFWRGHFQLQKNNAFSPHLIGYHVMATKVRATVGLLSRVETPLPELP